ncbi:MAG: TolC family protein [Gammaproteobacteria bacterium]|nr:TolC family protein [Gammaproteobacteria bacterium]
MPRRLWTMYLFALAMASGNAAAQEPPANALPEPLTLEFALSQAESAHPQLEASRHLIESREARRRQAESANDYRIDIDGRLRWIDLPAGAPSPGLNDDHALAITLEKPLLDFGLSDERERAARLGEEGARQRYVDTVQLRRETIMRRYFDVLLADLQFFRENERMAVAFIRLDRARERQRLGQRDDLDILELERIYQKVRRDRYYFESQQRVTRARLAQAMNRPDQLSADLSRPELPQLKRKPPELEKLQDLARQHNPGLIALRKEAASAQSTLAATRKSDGLTVDAEMGYGAYAYQLPSRENWNVGIKFNYPLARGGRTEADIALAVSAMNQAQTSLRQAEMALQQDLLETWMDINTLRIERDEMFALYDYRGLKLDQTRTRYEQEMQADLGDTMVLFTDAEWRLRRTEYELALKWLKLEGLVGVPYEQFPRQAEQEN